MSNKQEISIRKSCGTSGCKGTMPAHYTHTRCSACRKNCKPVVESMAQRSVNKKQAEHDAMVHKRRENMDIGDPVSLFLNPHIAWLVIGRGQ